MEKQVLQKFIANSGYCSRRKAEEMIRNKKVKVNNEIAELGQRVDTDDEVKIGGKKIELAKNHIYIKLNKPLGYVCTNRKFRGEKNIFDIIKLKEKLNVAGRLDKNSRGLVLVTNDGELIQKITHPKFEHRKTYQIQIRDKKLNKEDIENILFNFKKGIDIGEGDGVVSVKEIEYLENNNPRRKVSYISDSRSSTGTDSLGSNLIDETFLRGKFKIIIAEGKKRQIRRMFKKLGLRVADLVRIGISNLNLDNLKEGEWKYLSEKEIKSLEEKI